jgi:hypothetical protein
MERPYSKEERAALLDEARAYRAKKKEYIDTVLMPQTPMIEVLYVPDEDYRRVREERKDCIVITLSDPFYLYSIEHYDYAEAAPAANRNL